MTTEVVVVTTTNTVVTENTATNVVEVTASGTTPTVDIIAEGPAGPPGGQVTVQDEGITVGTLDDKLNFVGSMVGVTNNPATETITVTVTAPSPNVTLTGAVTGSGTMTNLGNVSIATTATADPTLTLAGDATGTATFTNLGDATLTVTVVDDSHNHIISNVDGLQDALDLKAPLASPTFTGTVTLPSTTSVGTVSATEISYLDGVTSGIQAQIDSKLPSASYTAADVLTKIKTVDGVGSGLDADLLDGESGAYYLDFTNATNKPDPTITLSGDATGSVTLTDLASGTLSVTVVDDSHNHIISNVDGLQDALDAKLPSASYTAADVLDKIKTVDGVGSGLDADLLDGQSSAYYTAINDRLGYTAENAANKGVANGYASLDGAGLVPSTQLPSYVDDVLEYANVAAFPATGVSGVIYVAIDTSKTYRWAGSVYVEISASPGSTDAVPEGSVNLYFTTARARQSLSAGTGISYSTSTGVITNSAPDQTVVLSAGTGISTSGTYPNFTITNSAPDQTVALTGSGTTSISGTYPNFTISSADQYVGTVTSVALSGGTTGLTVTGSPITSSGTLTLGGTLALASGGTGATTAADARTNLGLGTAATTDASAYATAAQGAKADTAVQTITSADGSVTITGTTAIDLSVVKATNASNLLVPVRNATGATLTKGTAVYISGATGQISTVTKAIASGDSTSAQTLGLIAADLPNNTNGNVILIGTLTGVNTAAYSDGQQLYLSPSVAGNLTATKPYAPDHLVYIAVVEYAHAINGKLFVKVQNGYELDELHDVAAQSPTNGQTIVYNSTSGLWEKNTVSLTAGVNGTLPVANGGTGQTSFTNGQLLIGNTTGNTLTKATLTAGTNVSITNGSGSITINATDQYVGTVTSVAALTLGTTGTDLSSSVANGTTTPVITLNVPTASATNRGALSSTDWSTFNGKQAALVSGTNIKTVNGTTLLGSGDLGTIGVAYGGTGATSLTSGYLLKGNGTSAVSASVVYDSGTNVGIGTASPGVKLDVAGDIRSTSGNYYAANGGVYGWGSLATYVGGSSATNIITFQTNSSERMRIDSSGNVGIGTSSPTTKLQIGDISAADATYQGRIKLEDTSGSLQSVGGLEFATSSFGAGYGWKINSIDSSGVHLVFGTRQNSANWSEMMRINSSGNVGIGTTGPSFKLDVQGNSSSTATVVRSRNNDTSASSLAAFNCSTGEGVNAEWYSYSSANWFGTKSNHPQLFITNNTERVRIDSSGNVGIGTSSPQSKMEIRATSGGSVFNALTLSNYVGASVGTGVALYFDPNGAGTLARAASIQSVQATSGNYADLRFFTANSDTPAERMRIDSSGNLGVGTTTPDVVRMRSKGVNTAATHYAMFAENSSNVDLFYARNDGAIGTGTATNSPYNLTTASAANVFVTSAGLLQRSTSSARYKTDIQDAVHGLSDVLALRPVTYKGMNDGETVFGGLIAEEVDAAGLTEFVAYDDQGRPDALHYGPMVSVLIKAMQEQQVLINDLTARVAELEGK